MDPDPQHWLGESDPAGVICTMMDESRIACLAVPYRLPLTGAAQLHS
jgi:hypothetical protein